MPRVKIQSPLVYVDVSIKAASFKKGSIDQPVQRMDVGSFLLYSPEVEADCGD